MIKKNTAYRRNHIRKWLIQNRQFLNITGFEKELLFPKGTIQKFTRHNKTINNNRIIKLENVIKELVDSYDNDEYL